MKIRHWFILALPFGAVILSGWLAMEKIKEAFEKAEFFTPSEFGVDAFLVKPELVGCLDNFRRILGVPVYISAKDNGGVFRRGTGTSFHFRGLAVDIKYPVYPPKHEKAGKRLPFAVIDGARKLAGFTGFGLYPWGFHLDLRPDRTPENPARWAWDYKPDGTPVEMTQSAFLAVRGTEMGIV